MEIKKTYKSFRYESDVCLKSGRRGTVCSPGKPDLEVSSPPEFKGEAGLWTPEEMFVASVNACTFMTFIAYARHKGLDVVSYESDGEGVLEHSDGKFRFTEISLRPHVRVKSASDEERAREIMQDAQANCFVANSLSFPVKVSPRFSVT